MTDGPSHEPAAARHSSWHPPAAANLKLNIRAGRGGGLEGLHHRSRRSLSAALATCARAVRLGLTGGGLGLRRAA